MCFTSRPDIPVQPVSRKWQRLLWPLELGNVCTLAAIKRDSSLAGVERIIQWVQRILQVLHITAWV